jgi:hypothetical protein
VTYIVIGDETHKTNTDEEVAEARKALADAGLEKADEFAGEPDGLGDSYRNGNIVWAAKLKSEPEYYIGHSVEKWLRLLAQNEEERAAVARLANFHGTAKDLETAAGMFRRANDEESARALLAQLDPLK